MSCHTANIERRSTVRTDEWPLLSIVIPCRNEERFIAQCLDSIIRNDYPRHRLEVLVVDGMSTDATAPIVGAYSKRQSFVRLVSNPRRITPAALNIGIAAATGEIVCRIDAHARVATDYLRRCAQWLLSGGADNIGGAMRTLPRNSSLGARSIAICMSHRFGVGNSAFRRSGRAVAFVDTVFGGCYRRETFERIGEFNERLIRTQDMEFNQRLRKSGGRIVLDPAIQCDYFASPDLRSFAKHNFKDGLWSILPFAYSNVMPIRWRHLVPLAFIVTSLALAAFGHWFRSCWLLGLAVVLAYGVLSLSFAFQLSLRNKHAAFLFMMPLVFAVRHFAYGLGSLCGAFVLFGKAELFARSFCFESPKGAREAPATRSKVE